MVGFGHKLIGLGGENCKDLKRRRGLIAKNRWERKKFVLPHLIANLGLVPFFPAPFVKAIGRDQAPLVQKERPKATFGKALGPNVEHGFAALAREPPDHRLKKAHGLILANAQHFRARRDIQRKRQLPRRPLYAVTRLNIPDVYRLGKPSAHKEIVGQSSVHRGGKVSGDKDSTQSSYNSDCMNLELLTEKKKRLDEARPLPPEAIRNLAEWYRVELTYTSNAIEGNTLSRQETALVVEKGITVGGKSLREHLEAVNHAAAVDLIRRLADTSHGQPTENELLDIHRLILAKISDADAGRYRNVSVRIVGSTAIMPNPLKVPSLMKDFFDWLSSTPEHPVRVAAEAHYRLVTIHPFIDGNGRTARLLMNLLLIRNGYPPAVLAPEDRLTYVNALEKGQTGGSSEDFYQYIYKEVDRSLDITLQAAGE